MPPKPPPSPGTATHRTVGFALGVVLSLGPSGSASAQQAEEALASLRQADRFRQEDAREAQAWAEEKARLELLLATLQEQAAALRKRSVKDRRTLQRERSELPPPPEAILSRLEAAALRVARDIHQGLQNLERQVPPGVVPSQASGRTTPEQAVDGALHRLERTERAMRSVEVLVASGQLNGQLRSVELVRVGGVAAWWRSLDGLEGGEATMFEGQLVLFPVKDPEDLAAIGRAADIAKGRRAPEVVVLPARRARGAP